LPPGSIEIDLLGTRFSLATEDETWHSFLSELWGGFTTTDGGPARRIEIEAGPAGLSLRLPEQPELTFDEPWTLAEVLRYWLAEDALKATTGLVLIHAATVLRDDRAALLVGGSGAGKTSLTLALVEAGWTLGSDDVAPLDPATGLIRPFPKPLGIRDPGLWRSLDRTGWLPPWPEHEGSAILVPPCLFASAQAPFSAAWVAFISFDPHGGPARLRALTGGRTAARLSEHTRTLSAEAVGALARLCEGAAGAELDYPTSAAGVHLVERLTNS
jgi:hypothetical protein